MNIIQCKIGWLLNDYKTVVGTRKLGQVNTCLRFVCPDRSSSDSERVGHENGGERTESTRKEVFCQR